MSQLPNTDIEGNKKKPLGLMTKTEMEMQDFSSKQIKSGLMLVGIILLGVYVYKNFIKNK